MAKPKRRQADELAAATELRIIAGKFRGRKLKYEPFRIGDDPVTRPMKHRVRESIFNLVSQGSEGRHAIDLFAGTGALGLEALSRGAAHATFIERHVPTARVIEENIKALGVENEATLLVTSAFLWGKRNLPNADCGLRIADLKTGIPKEQSEIRNPKSEIPWLVFCSPPYAFYVERQAEMLELMTGIMDHAPPDSLFVVEADERFDFELLPGEWDVRTYSPAVVGVWHKKT
jgi:16S rRNA (guanine966-N2)-methyltransferase